MATPPHHMYCSVHQESETRAARRNMSCIPGFFVSPKAFLGGGKGQSLHVLPMPFILFFSSLPGILPARAVSFMG